MFTFFYRITNMKQYEENNRAHKFNKPKFQVKENVNNRKRQPIDKTSKLCMVIRVLNMYWWI